MKNLLKGFINMKRTKIIYMFLMSPPHEKLISKFNSIEDYTTHYAQSVGDLHYLDVNEEVRRVFFYLQDFCHLLMKEILSRTNDYELEIWRSYLGITQVYTKEVEGITHRLFPAKKVKKITGSYKTHSNDLLTRLKKTIKTENVLLITSYPSQYTTCFLLKLKPVNVPLIAIHRGWRLARFKSPTKTKFDIIEKLNDSLEIKCFRKYIDVFRCNIRKQIDYLKNEKGLENVAQFTDGIDYNFYKPCEDKERLKQELNLPCNKKILLYIGKFTKFFMKTHRFKTRLRGMSMCRGSNKAPMSKEDKEARKKLSEIHRKATKAALEKQRAKAAKKE